jgi:hypothetical protein
MGEVVCKVKPETIMKTAAQVLENIKRNSLYSAQLGIKLLASEDPHQRMAGLRNVAVFGRSVTFGIQNLKSTEIGEERFNAWYTVKQEEMRADPVMLHFVTVRNEIEKQGLLKVHSSLHIKHFSSQEMRWIMYRFPPPPGYKGFFMADRIGGSGYDVETEDGKIEKLYITVGSVLGSNVTIKVLFADAPQELPDEDVSDLAQHYVDRLTNLVEEAEKEFSK